MSPDPAAHPRLLKSSLPTANYSVKGLVRGPAGNKTGQYLAAIDPQDPGQQGFYREALNDIPHPLEAGKTMNYGGLQALLNSPQRGAVLDAYARQNRLQKAPTAEQFQAEAFAAAHARMLERGAANPGELAFPASADAARRAPAAQMALAHGNYVQPQGGAVVDAASQAQRFADLPADAAYAAPGTPMRLVRGAAPVPAARVIPGSVTTR